ncbi:winged helix-turn-helix transcriptional regulator [Halopseudomonas salegens]|uniref:Transcriptional regulator, HxlR family n=1 Tax=Halopseudomonas salegens TaxID=1434072 RepID=A0A1H2FFU9_9GAMM|nr:helix-turn-helix domain-containing protein [Halopseudomonas salegens]SDU06267.1 transcriptional regulator, HxlR family [Halopseudomonas salegens]
MLDKFPCRSHCPINYALESFGDKWTLLIIRDLMFKAKQSYGDFLASNEKISTNILADRLKRLEEMGIVIKSVNETNRTKMIYSLTPKGQDLLPIMLEITKWSGKYDAQTNAPKPFLDSIENDRLRLIEDIQAGWKSAKKQ